MSQTYCKNGSYARPQQESKHEPKAAHLKANLSDRSTRNVEMDDMTF